MILRRLILGLAGAAALAASAAVMVVALAFALYALVEPYVGRAGAAAIVVGSAALLMALCAALIFLVARPRRRKALPPKAMHSLVDRALEFVRDKPVVSIAASLAAGLFAIRDPKYLGAAIRAFLEGRPPERGEARSAARKAAKAKV